MICLLDAEHTFEFDVSDTCALFELVANYKLQLAREIDLEEDHSSALATTYYARDVPHGRGARGQSMHAIRGR